METENLAVEEPTTLILPEAYSKSQQEDDATSDDPQPEEKKSNPLKHGLVWYIENGFYVPVNGKVIARAIMPTDFSAFGGGALDNVIDTRFAVAWEIVALAPDIPKESGLQVGMWFHHLSTSSNRIDKEAKSSRYYSLWYQDVEGVFWPAEENDDGDLEGTPVDMPEQQMVTAPYPWVAQKIAGRDAWCIIDGNQEDIGVRLKRATAEQIVDAVNRRSALSGTAPQAASFPVEAAEEPAPPTPKETLGKLLETLTVDQKQTVLIAEEVKGVEAAINLAEGFVAIGKQKEYQTPEEKHLPATNTAGEYGVYANPASPPVARFNTFQDAELWSRVVLGHVQTSVRKVGEGLDQPPVATVQKTVPQPSAPVPPEGAVWGPPPGWAKRL